MVTDQSRPGAQSLVAPAPDWGRISIRPWSVQCGATIYIAGGSSGRGKFLAFGTKTYNKNDRDGEKLEIDSETRDEA
jgi:hypothetical protein